MLTFRQLEDAGVPIEEIMGQAMEDIIEDIARRITKMGIVTDSAQWQMSRLEAIGAERDYIMRRLHSALSMSETEIIRIFDEACTRALATDDRIYRAAGYNPIPLADNPYMQQIIRAGLQKTLGEFQNLTNTTANTATLQFENMLDAAYNKVVTGGFSYQQAIKSGVSGLTQKGIASIIYPTGHFDYMDVAFRRALLTGVNQTAAELQLHRMDELGTDLVETTAHYGARTAPMTGPANHAWWQGRWFSRSTKSSKYPDFITNTGYGTGEGLCGWNCRHSFFPVIEGLSDRAYDLDTLRQYNNKMVTYNGESMNLYDATQKQRHIERQIRRWKREDAAMAVAGNTESNPTAKAEFFARSWFAHDKVLEWQAQQRDFIAQTGLGRDYFRERAGAQIVA